ncbi:F0F1 ATP synthase subunit A, partial [Vibrio parahaemolyticus]|nr:F0F1 ATP synthase subunit A [Vibrio parahaemolyticus]
WMSSIQWSIFYFAVITIQAVVFTMLTTVYRSMAHEDSDH